MKAISIECPKCSETSDLYLGSDAFMIILNCPGCGTPLVYYYGKTVEVTEMQIEQIQKCGQLRNAGDLLREISQSGVKLHTPKSVKPYMPATKVARSKPKIATGGTSHKKGQAIRAEYLTKDDILNLKIELETCSNVWDFLAKI